MGNCEETGISSFAPNAEFACLVGCGQHLRLDIVIVERDLQRKKMVHDLFCATSIIHFNFLFVQEDNYRAQDSALTNGLV
jgi:hypothetical protein